MTFTLESPAFAAGTPMPLEYTGDGANISPPLSWAGQPEGTRSFAIVVEDPDAPAGLFFHWGIYNITGSALEEDAGNPDMPNQARNDFGNMQYDGPAPPIRHGVHRYRFRIAALNVAELPFEVTPSSGELWSAAQPYRLAEAELVGTYERKEDPSELRAELLAEKVSL